LNFSAAEQTNHRPEDIFYFMVGVAEQTATYVNVRWRRVGWF